MVSPVTLNFVHRRLCAIADSSEPFGGYNVMVFGDFFQLRPVRGHYLFTDTVLWPLFKPSVLQINQRQKGHDKFVALLNRIRIGHVTAEDMAILSSRLVNKHKNIDMSTILHIFPTLKQSHVHNNKMQQLLNPNFHCHEASHVYSKYDMEAGYNVASEYIPDDDRHAGGLPSSLQISLGTRVMLLRNLLTEEGLVNGAMGVVVHMDIVDGVLKTVYVKFDDSTVGRRFQEAIHDNSIPVCEYRQEFLYKGRYIDRVTFPIIPCWATTVHKTQGISLESAVVSLGAKLFQAGQAYVAISRVRSLEGLYVLDLCPERIYADENVLKLYDEMSQTNGS